MPIQVAIVEDNPDYRMGTSFLLRSSRKFNVVGEFSNAEDFLQSITAISPDVVLMDIGLPKMSGIEATAVIKEKYPRLQVIMLSVFEDDDNVFKAICAGANGYVTKPANASQLHEGVEDAYNGGTPMSPHIARKVLELFRKHIPPPNAEYNLTSREQDILERLVQGDDCKTIADKLFLSIFTVRAHIRNIYDKLHVHSLSQVVSKALKERLVPQQ